MSVLEFAVVILGPQPGVTVFLLVCLTLALLAYNRERTKRDQASDARLKDAREDTELLVETVHEAVNTVKELKLSNDALKIAFEALTSTIRERSSANAQQGKSAKGV